jgi:hypothetical protein
MGIYTNLIGTIGIEGIERLLGPEDEKAIYYTSN